VELTTLKSLPPGPVVGKRQLTLSLSHDLPRLGYVLADASHAWASLEARHRLAALFAQTTLAHFIILPVSGAARVHCGSISAASSRLRM
jgi:hypothetical protein